MQHKSTIMAETTSFYVMIKIPFNLPIEERSEILLRGNKPKNDNRHITLIDFKVYNHNLQIQTLLQDQSFLDFVRKSYDTHLSSVSLIHVQRDFELLGKGTHVFWGKKFQLSDTEASKITNFRTCVYKEIQRKMGATCDINKNDPEWVIYSYGGRKAFAVPKHSWGKGVWKPHISIVNTGDIEIHNKALFNTFYVNGAFDRATALISIHDYIGQNMADVLSSNHAINSQGMPRIKVFPFSDIQLAKTHTLHMSFGNNNLFF